MRESAHQNGGVRLKYISKKNYLKPIIEGIVLFLFFLVIIYFHTFYKLFVPKHVIDYFPVQLHKIKYQEGVHESDNRSSLSDECVEVNEMDGKYPLVLIKTTLHNEGTPDFIFFRQYLIKPDVLYLTQTYSPNLNQEGPNSFSTENLPIVFKIPGNTESNTWNSEDRTNKVYFGSIKTGYKKYDDCLVVESEDPKSGNVGKDYYAKGVGWVFHDEGDKAMQLVDKN